MDKIIVQGGSTDEEKERREAFVNLFHQTPIPSGELLSNLGLYLNRQTLARILFMYELYQKIINVHGVIMEFGVRWGQNLALFESLRGIFEPYNYNRKIIGFDTFLGFTHVSEEDGAKVNQGDYKVVENYERYLEKILFYHEAESPISHKKKFELIKGDAIQTICTYMEEHTETIVSLAYFDFDLYAPTKACLEAIRNRLTKGSIIAFDELNTPELPGETIAVHEVLGINKMAIRRSPLNPLCSYVVVE